MKNAVFEYLAKLFAKSRIFCLLSRRTLQICDNDSSVDMRTNGESALMKKIMPLLDKASVVIDVGCNVGDWSSMIAELGYNGSLLMLDMDDDACRQSHLAMGKYSELRAEIITAMVCEETRMDRKYYKGKDSAHNSVFDMQVFGDTEAKVEKIVNSVSLDDFLRDRFYVNFFCCVVENFRFTVTTVITLF